MTFLPLSVLFYLRILVKLHAIRRFLLSLVGRTLDRGFSAPELAHRFDWQERGCILSPTPDVICMLHFLFLTLTYFKTSQFMVCNVYQMQLNKGWIIIFLYYFLQARCNILDASLCALRVVLQWEYKFFMVLLELHKVIFNHWTPDVVNFWYAIHCWFLGENWITIKIIEICGDWVHRITSYFCTNIELVNHTLPSI